MPRTAKKTQPRPYNRPGYHPTRAPWGLTAAGKPAKRPGRKTNAELRVRAKSAKKGKR